MRWTLLALLVACSKKTPPVVDGPSMVPRDAAIIVDAAVPPAFGEGAHDYRGTLGAKTSIALHLVRTGDKLAGAYAYTKIGKPIGLEGTVGPDGALALDEFVGGKVTGHLALKPDGAGLGGQWSDLARKKTIPLALGPGAPLASLGLDAGTRPGANAQAEQCLADLDCSPTDADSLFLLADAASDPELDCSRFLDGIGVAKNPARGRACYERSGRSDCGGASPDLPLGELLELRIDGVGGPRDLAGVQKLLAGCYDDVTTQALRERASLVAKTPSTPPVDFCKSIGGTQMVTNDCTLRDVAREHDRASLVAKKVTAGLDAKGRTLFRTATKAFRTFVSADTSHVLAAFAGGSIRYAMANERERELEAERAKDLAGLDHYLAPATLASDLEQAKLALDKAIIADAPDRSLPPAELAEQQKTADEAQLAWKKYRDAEVAFYVHVFGGKQGAPQVRDALTVLLTNRRSKTVAAPSAGGE